MVKQARTGTQELILLLSVVSALLTFRCANQLPPGGGEIDYEPPEIVSTYPPDGTTNYTEDYVEIEFSEYVDKRSAISAIFISPFIEGALDYSFGGDNLTITFPSELKENITYTITVGTDVVDYNNKNRMAQSHTFAFSTGDKIDIGEISGSVFDEEPSGVIIAAYKVLDDSTQPFTRKGDYISQAGEDGYYRLTNLAKGTYRVFAIKDAFRDYLFQPGNDNIGIPFQEITLTEEDSTFSNMNFLLMDYDTAAPGIISASMTDKNHILLNFTEDVDSVNISAQKYTLYDSTALKTIPVQFAYKGNTKETEMVLVISDSVGVENFVYLYADSLIDAFGNLNVADTLPVSVSEKPDTLLPELNSVEPTPKKDIELSNPEFRITFKDAFSFPNPEERISVIDSLKREVRFTHKKIDDAAFCIKIEEELRSLFGYAILMDMNKIRDAAGNRLDTVYTHSFLSMNELDYTGLQGGVFNIEYDRNPILLLQHEEGDRIYKATPKIDSTFAFKNVLPGNYYVWLYYDEDQNGRYTFGNPFPYVAPEEFRVHPTIVELEKRWTVTDFVFDFDACIKIPLSTKQKQKLRNTSRR